MRCGSISGFRTACGWSRIILAARDVIVSHQTVGLWAEKFGRHIANDSRKRPAGNLGDKWHPDEVAITIAGRKHRLRCVDAPVNASKTYFGPGMWWGADVCRALVERLQHVAGPFSGRKFTGEVVRIAPTAVARSHSVRVFLAISNYDRPLNG